MSNGAVEHHDINHAMDLAILQAHYGQVALERLDRTLTVAPDRSMSHPVHIQPGQAEGAGRFAAHQYLLKKHAA